MNTEEKMLHMFAKTQARESSSVIIIEYDQWNEPMGILVQLNNRPILRVSKETLLFDYMTQEGWEL